MDGWTLAVDVGAVWVVAAVRDEGRAEIVEFEGGLALPPVVFFGADQPPLAGQPAADRSASAPDRAVPSPRRALAAADTVTLAGTVVPLSQAYAAILGVVGRDALRGRVPAVPVRLVFTHPARWGNRELAVLSKAAANAALPVPDFVAEPVAAACHLAADTAPGQYVAVLDADTDSVDTAVLRRTREGFTLAGAPGGQAWAAGDDPGVVLRQGAYELLATITNAGLAPGRLAAVHVVGEASLAHRAADLIVQILGTESRVAPNPRTAVILGALSTTAQTVPHPGPATAIPTGTTSTGAGAAGTVSSARPEDAAASRSQCVGGRGSSSLVRSDRHFRWPHRTPAQGVGIGISSAVVAAITVVLATAVAVAVVVAVVLAQSNPIAHTNPVGFKVTVHSLRLMPRAPVSYTVTAQYPVITGLGDAGLQQRLNVELRAPVARQVAAFSALSRTYPEGSSGAFMMLKETAYRAGQLLSVKYVTFTHNSGAGDVSYGLQTVTIRMDAGTVLNPAHILTTTALTKKGLGTLAVDLQAQKGISECDTQPGWTGESSIPSALARIGTPGWVVINVTRTGLAFSFGDDAISPTVCQPTGVVPFSELSGLVNPSIVALAANAAP